MTVSAVYRRVHDAWNYRLRNFNRGRWASHCRPTTIVLLLTERCNAKCLHCDIWKNTGKEDTPSFEQWKQVLSDLRGWLGPVTVTLSGGEALIRPFATDLVAHGSKLGLFMEHLTHGYWEDQTKIERLALARPGMVTISFDGIGETHTRIRGRPMFWERTTRTIETLLRMRREHQLPYTVRLKHVIMSHNLNDTVEVARFANRDGMEVFYQPIEQNYNTQEDANWHLGSSNWPQDTNKVVSNVRTLIELKKQGYHIANSLTQLEVMIPYFQDPDAHRVTTMSHSAHERKVFCSALTHMQVHGNGDVRPCAMAPPVGNIRQTPIREIWTGRPRFWEGGCCLTKRLTEREVSSVIPAESLQVASEWKSK
ncbi:MAG: radical SAM protein [Bryobacterales bacterium]|nr:radical SAM protein [Bryobacterales bacterium]